MAPCTATFELSGPSQGACWEAGGLPPRAEWRGQPLPFAANVATSLGKVAEAVAAQAMPWQPASRYSVQVGKIVETPVTKLSWDPPGLRALLCTLLWLVRIDPQQVRGELGVAGGAAMGPDGVNVSTSSGAARAVLPASVGSVAGSAGGGGYR